jgi:hypothetical protein
MFDRVVPQRSWPQRTTPTRNDMSVHEHLGDDNFSDDDRLGGRVPGANPPGGLLVEASIGRWVITLCNR